MRLAHLFTLSLALLLTACGFHLRGTGSYNFQLTELDFRAADILSPLAKTLESRLEAQGVELTPEAEYTLYLEREENTSRIVSFTAGTRSSERMLTSAVNLEIRYQNLPALYKARAEVQRTLDFNQNNVSASDEEKSMLTKEMRNELVTQVLMRLQSIKLQELEELRLQAIERQQMEEEAKQRELERLQQELNLEPLPY